VKEYFLFFLFYFVSFSSTSYSHSILLYSLSSFFSSPLCPEKEIDSTDSNNSTDREEDNETK